MEEGAEQPVCPVCIEFEPQAWRKSLCRNCFKTFEQHMEEKLAAQAGAASSTSTSQTSDSKAEAKQTDEKESKGKSSAKESTHKLTEKPPLSPTSSSSSSKASSSALSSKSSTTTSASAIPTSESKVISSSKSSISSSSTSSTPLPTSTTTKSSEKSSLACSKAKEAASKLEEKSKLSGNNSSHTSVSSRAGASEKKVSLVASLAGKIDPSAKRGADGKPPRPPTDGQTGATTDSKTKAPVADAEKKKTLSLFSGSKTGVKEKEASPSPPSPSPCDSSARAKWEKRVSAGGGGGGTGAKSFDVTKGQKGTDLKGVGKAGGDTHNIGGGTSVGKGRLGDLGARKSGKEADVVESALPPGQKQTSGKTSTSTSSTATDRSPTSKVKSPSPSSSSSKSPSPAKSPPPPSSPTKQKNVSPTTTTTASKAPASSSPAAKSDEKTDEIHQDSDSTVKDRASADSDDAAVALLLTEKEKKLKELEEKTGSLEKELAEKNETLSKKLTDKEEELHLLKEEKARKEQEVNELRKRLTQVEKEASTASEEMERKRTASIKGQREEWEKTLSELRTQVSRMEEQCSRLEGDNQSLLSTLREQEQAANRVANNQDTRDNEDSEVCGLQGELKTSELEVESLRDENMELRQQLSDMRREMDEMYDTFRENELDEFRELQRELDLTAKNCRVLQFKLRKAERRADQVDSDRQHYEEKLRSLQKQFESGDARSHIESLEEELRTAKEVSVRLHDELDLMEDRRNKALEDNRHLTELLEQTDKKQFRMEMEIDKLRDQIADLKQQLRERSPTRKEGTPDRRDVLGRQGSQEYDNAQLMRDLCDSVERETDLKEQLKFLEEESRMLRKKLAEMEDENEALRVQLKKLSLKASRWKEESEGRGHGQGRQSEDHLSQERERLDSSDDETSVMTLKLQLALIEQELMTSQRGQAEVEKEAETLQAEVTSLQAKLRAQEQEAASQRDQHAPPDPDAYYEEKVRELIQVSDELRWRIIEKDREIERLSTASIAHARHHGHHGHGSRRGDLKKSRSLDSDLLVEDLRRQLDASHHDVSSIRNQVSLAREQRQAAEKETLALRQQLQEHQLLQQQLPPQQQQLPQTTMVPCIQADDAAVENIELRDALKRAEEELRVLREQVRMLTDKLHALSRAPSPRLPSATPSPISPTPPVLSVARATESTFSTTATTPAPTAAAAAPTPPEPHGGIPHVPGTSAKDSHEQLKKSEDERRTPEAKMAELEGDHSKPSAVVSGMAGGSPGKAGPVVGLEKKSATQKMERRAVSIGEDQTREVLIEQILDMEEKINHLLVIVKQKHEETDAKSREIASLREKLQDAEDVGRRTELQLLQELEMLHDKNSVLSNLLDIVHERADNAEQELERYMQENSAPSTRSASAVSQVSALSDASCGSDEVFLAPPIGGLGEKGQIIHRDWETKLKNRIESLERLLAEERQKVSTAEKKLQLSVEHGVAPSLSDDVKLRLREKELLQEELFENQRHLRVATDQIKGMRERLHALEEEHHRLKVDYGKLCNELDRQELESDQTDQDSDKTPENSVEPEGSLVALRAARLQALSATLSETTDKLSSARTYSRHTMTTEGDAKSLDDVTALESEMARYKLKSEQLEYKVEEISDIWRSKSEATEKEKKTLEAQLKEKSQEISQIREIMDQLRNELKTQSTALVKAEEKAVQVQDEMKRRQAAEQELHALLTQSTEREHHLRQLREAVSARDERLKEKDDIIHYLNSLLEQRQVETHQLQERVTDMTSQNAGQPLASPQASSKEMIGETDVEKENARLREKIQSLRLEMEEGDATRKDLEKSRRVLEEASLVREKERADLQAALNVSEEKLRLYEILSSSSSNQVVENIKKESLKHFQDKEELAAQVTSLQHELVTCQRNAVESASRLKQEVTKKLHQLREETESSKRMQTELDRLRTQAERACRLQQEERLLRAEHQALKVRYGTRMEKMSQDYSKMMLTIEALQKEKAADRELMAGVEKALILIKEAHAQDQTHWEDEKVKLDRQIKELTETQQLVKLMQQKTSELKTDLAQQERARADMVNKYATDRAAWEINKATLQSRINQLEEQLTRIRKDAGSSTALETAWANERAQQQRLLTEAHNLALDLQKQLTSRNLEAEDNQRHLTEQLQAERKSWDKERKEKDKQLTELQSRVQWQESLQRRVLEVQDRAEREVQKARSERAEITKRLLETRQQQARDARAFDDVMAGLVRLRELGTMLDSEDGKPREALHRIELDRNFVKFIKETIAQISAAADDLTKRGSNGGNRIRRSLSSSELELLRQELQDSGDVFPVHDVIVAGTKSYGLHSQPLRSTSLDIRSSDVPHSNYQHHVGASRSINKTPSYTSGTHSAHGSRATSPDGHHLADLSLSKRFLESSSPMATGKVAEKQSVACDPLPNPGQASQDKLNTPRPQASSLFDEKDKLFSTGPSVSMVTGSATTTVPSSETSRPSRPRTLTKSLSVDSQPSWMPNPLVPRSYSASTTPTQPGPAPLVTSDSDGASSPYKKRCFGGVSPRTARRKFFEQQPAEKVGFMSWPERGKHSGLFQRSLQVHGVDPGEVRRDAEEEHEWLLSRVTDATVPSALSMKTSTSWDEKIHHRVVATPTEASSAPRLSTERPLTGDEQSQKPSAEDGSASLLQGTHLSGKRGLSSAKDRRRLFKKSSSLDSDVGTCIARAGMTTLLPPAVPSTFSPSDFLATLRGKLAPTFGRTTKEDNSNAPRPPSPLFIPTAVPDIPLRNPTSSSTTTTTVTITTSGTPTTNVRSGESEAAANLQREQDQRGRGLGRRQDQPRKRDSHGDATDTRWRSVSADRATRPLMVHTDVIVPAQIWQFSETAV